MFTFKHYYALQKHDLFSLTETTILVEGGNVWKGDLATVRIDRKNVVPTVQFLERIVGFPLVNTMVGTTGKAPTSGDIDLLIDASKHDKEDVVNRLKAWAAKNDPKALVKKSGINVHFRTPINGNPNSGYVQTDMMFMPDTSFATWSMASPEQSSYKNVHREILIRSIAKFLGLRYSWMNGLTSRATGNVIPGGKDPETIAHVLLGPGAKPEDLMSVESIMAKLKNDPDRDAKLADARETLGKEGIRL